MSRLLDDLRQTASAGHASAAARRQADEQEAATRRAEGQVRYAAKIIDELPLKLKVAAKDGDHLDVKTLDFTGDYDRADTEKLKLAAQLEPLEVVALLTGTARIVAEWLLKEGLTVTLRFDARNDSGQGRSWTDVVLVASGW